MELAIKSLSLERDKVREAVNAVDLFVQEEPQLVNELQSLKDELQAENQVLKSKRLEFESLKTHEIGEIDNKIRHVGDIKSRNRG